MSDEYEHVSRGKLKLKSDSDIKKKKKKKSKDKEKLREKVEKTLEESGTSSREQDRSQAPPSGRVLTKAEESFKKMQEKMQKKRIMEKASMTHKQRVEQFNQHLDSLTEHFDIPKVSWTK
ncbi:AAEL009779-PA [Aedes aegypti]|uniref:AAEL009779-PA n=2 Tax=Aedes aegypti TaxID=7159 RepID=A0A1S4FNI2_AEDAE|nr:protein FAM32A [Aedes aegypti]EAT38322.1 AAEL009779-PA [Aedes aegypti]